MPPIRFLHAAGLDPEAPLPRTRSAGGAQYDVAPLAAIERLVSRAIELQVDFLLVTPAIDPSGDTVELGFRTALAVRKELSRLVAHAIPVYLAVRSRKSAWNALADRETTVSIVATGEAATINDSTGHAAATLRGFADWSDVVAFDEDSRDSRSTAVQLAIVPGQALEERTPVARCAFDYIGFGAGCRSTMPGDAGLAHAPGAIQATSSHDCGPGGATLVTIGADGEVQTGFIPIATVRYESITLHASPDLAIEDVAELMAKRLAELRIEAGEVVWSLLWTIETAGTLLDLLSNAAERATLAGLLPETTRGVTVAHRIQAVPRWESLRLDDPCAVEFAAALADQDRSLADSSKRLALAGISAEMPHRSRLARLIGAADSSAVLNRARQTGVRIIAAAHDGDDG